MKLRESKTGEAVYTMIFTVTITALCIAVVAGAYQLTKAKIELNERQFIRRAILEAAGHTLPNSPAEIEQLYLKEIRDPGDSPTPSSYRTASGNYVFPSTGTGLWGRIDAMIGLSRDFQTITGVSFTANNETPGLGARIDEDWFRKQFKGKRGPLTFVNEGSKSTDDRQFDGITGATVTTSAVRDMINKTLKNAPAAVWEVKSK